MKRLFAPFVYLLLALALVLAGPGAARSAVGGTMLVLCANGAAKTVWIGADGEPVDPAADCLTCPDCMTPTAGLADPVLSQAPFVLRIVPAGHAQVAAVVLVPTPPLFPAPRGPPAASALRIDVK